MLGISPERTKRKRTHMSRFVAGILATVAVYLLGWDTIESALERANHAARSAYAALESSAEHVRAESKR